MARIYYFGHFCLDPAARLLQRHNRPVSLAPKAFDCIAYLIEHRDRAVGRDELIANVWGKVDVADNVLGQVIARSRRALGDVGEDHVMIRTVLRFGYQWIAPTTMEPPPDPASGAPSGAALEAASTLAAVNVDAVPVAKAGRRKRLRFLAFELAVFVALLVMLIAAAWWRWPMLSPPSKAVAEPSALVLPVVVQGGGSAYGWVRLGAMDLIAERIRGAGAIVTPSENAVALAHDLGSDPVDAAQLQALAATAHVSIVVHARAEAVGDLWHVVISTSYGREPALSAKGESTDVLDATRRAADAFARSGSRRRPTRRRSLPITRSPWRCVARRRRVWARISTGRAHCWSNCPRTTKNDR